MRDVKRTEGPARRNVADLNSSKTPSHETGIIPDFLFLFLSLLPYRDREAKQVDLGNRNYDPPRESIGGKLTPRCQTNRDFKLLMKKLTTLDCLP